VKRGTLIVLEGLDGAGKSTQARLLARRLADEGHRVLRTREPTPGPVGRRLREHATAGEPLGPREECELFFQDRRWHAELVLRPALAAGEVVVCDRYFPSTVAYQGARGLDPQTLLAESELEFPAPDLAVLLRLPAEAGLDRVARRGEPRHPAFERVDLLARAAALFDAIERPWWTAIPAEGEPGEVAERLRAVLRERGLPRPA